MIKGNKLPTVALLGEFSAGKSTLANALLGTSQSTVRVTATQSPPIWYVAGSGLPVHIAADGTETECQTASLVALDLEDTRAVRVPLEAEILTRMTILDMPGSSDPSISVDVWEALLPMADIAIWCTPATQAWRQSEAAVWDTMPEELRERSLLLMTRMDKVASAEDRHRIVARVSRETAGLFRAVFPVSLLKATKPLDRCDLSGMSQVMLALEKVINGPGEQMIPLPKAVDAPAPMRVARDPTANVVPRRVASQDNGAVRRLLRRPPARSTST